MDLLRWTIVAVVIIVVVVALMFGEGAVQNWVSRLRSREDRPQRK